jgi:hypothetical protein
LAQVSRETSRHYIIRTTVTNSAGLGRTTDNRVVVTSARTSRLMEARFAQKEHKGQDRELHPGLLQDDRLFKLVERTGVLGQ